MENCSLAGIDGYAVELMGKRQMITPVTQIEKLTYADYLQTPDDLRYELIEGELLMTPAPTVYHQWLSKNIEFQLEQFVRKKGIGKVFYAPCDVYVDEENVLQPDIFFISKENEHIIAEKNIRGAPDLVVEILSESTAYRDLVQKKRLYARFGVKEYWIVDPGEQSIELFALKKSKLLSVDSYSLNDDLESPLLKDFKLSLADIFRYE